MKVTQIAQILNETINMEQIGESAVVNEDLSNIVDVGTAVLDYTTNTANFDSFIGQMIDRIGKVMFVDRPYVSNAPNIVKDRWEYGSVMQKVRCELPEARDNATWDLASYPIPSGDDYPDPFELTKPDVKAKFYNGKTTYEVPITLTQEQLKSAFTSAAEMSSFVAMIENRIRLKQTLSTEALVMRTIVTLMAQKIGTGNNVVNLLSLYNTATGSSITAKAAYTDPDFLRFAAKTIMLYRTYVQTPSMLYNNGGYVTFTPADRLKMVLLADFSKSMETMLYSNTYHEEFVKVEGYEEVGYWQGTGTANGDRDKINVKVMINGVLTPVEQAGIVGVIFDEWGAMVCNENYRVTSIYNPRGEYTNYFYKYDAHYMTDVNENCIVFVIA